MDAQLFERLNRLAAGGDEKAGLAYAIEARRRGMAPPELRMLRDLGHHRLGYHPSGAARFLLDPPPEPVVLELTSWGPCRVDVLIDINMPSHMEWLTVISEPLISRFPSVAAASGWGPRREARLLVLMLPGDYRAGVTLDVCEEHDIQQEPCPFPSGRPSLPPYLTEGAMISEASTHVRVLADDVRHPDRQRWHRLAPLLDEGAD
jgi:hypothetical protein